MQPKNPAGITLLKLENCNQKPHRGDIILKWKKYATKKSRRDEIILRSRKDIFHHSQFHSYPKVLNTLL